MVDVFTVGCVLRICLSWFMVVVRSAGVCDRLAGRFCDMCGCPFGLLWACSVASTSLLFFVGVVDDGF